MSERQLELSRTIESKVSGENWNTVALPLVVVEFCAIMPPVAWLAIWPELLILGGPECVS